MLSNELIQRIASFIDKEDVYSMSITCRTWNSALNDSHFRAQHLSKTFAKVHYFKFDQLSVDPPQTDDMDIFREWYLDSGRESITDDIYNKIRSKTFMQTIKNEPKSYKIGDLIRIDEKCLLFIYGGKLVQELTVFYNSLLCTPEIFKVPSDYQPMYFHGPGGIKNEYDSVYVRLDVPKYIDQLKQNAVVHVYHDHRYILTWFTKNKYKYYVNAIIQSFDYKYSTEQLLIFFGTLLDKADEWELCGNENFLVSYDDTEKTFTITIPVSIYE